jgi:hypothetical protein
MDIYTFCPYAGDIFAKITLDNSIKKIFTRWFKFDLHVNIFQVAEISVTSICFTFFSFFSFFHGTVSQFSFRQLVD